MRTILSLKDGWHFQLSDSLVPPQGGDPVVIPHTWNALDGQDGGNDYHRGGGWYSRIIEPDPSWQGMRVYAEFEGVSLAAEVFVNGEKVLEHSGGFTAFRAELTSYLSAPFTLSVRADNGPQLPVYPQQADFTFFGGMYRRAQLIIIPPAHFAFDPYVRVQDEAVTVCAPVENAAGENMHAAILNAEGECVTEAVFSAEDGGGMLRVPRPRLWNGRKDPYLYTARLSLDSGDTVEIPFGFRSFTVDPEKGFLLNGEPYPLHGVSRHQDRLDKGWAIAREDHEEDVRLICEMGANAVRLAHYPHDRYFYDLCDRAGLVVWAEIPFISVFVPGETMRENTLMQMREMICQQRNHPSICFWGISNEITIGGETPELLENLYALNALCHELDDTRLTTSATVTMTKPESEVNRITDVLAYNHYFGWYMGEVAENAVWLDSFHAAYPQRPLGLSEYGAEAVLKWHSEEPRRKDYSEEYQAYYHEKMLEIFSARPWIWSTYVWNMFDFAADSRDEGGVKGRNNKGLVTYDRKTKKDSFYLYKAYWSDTPFVHVCSKRFERRARAEITVKVYANCGPLTLEVNGKTIARQEAGPVYMFERVPLEMGENRIRAFSDTGETDTAVFERVVEDDGRYTLPQNNSELPNEIRNWFASLTVGEETLRFPEGYYSIRDSISDLLADERTYGILQPLFESFRIAGRNMSDSSMFGAISLEMTLNFISGLPAGAKEAINQKLIQIRKK